MTLLGGLFSRKHKSSPRAKRDENGTTSLYSNAASDPDSTFSSPTTSSNVAPDRTIPSNPNARNLLHPNSARENTSHNLYAPAMSSAPTHPGGGKLRHFLRKKSTTPGPDLNITSSPDISTNGLITPQRPTYQNRVTASGVMSETDPTDLRRLRPPPSRSAIFAAYGDSSSTLSTHSLPNDTSLPMSDASPPPSSPQPHKRPSIFAWAKPSSSASSSAPKESHDSESPTNLNDAHTFNLKSFRHIRPPSPTRSTNESNISLHTPIPRPRGASVNSDASQRISVAAFREAQARRSLAGSPSPSFRSPSPVPALPSTSHSKTPELTHGRNSPRTSRSTPHMPQSILQDRRRSSMAITSESDYDSSEEVSEDETMHAGHRNSQFDNLRRPGKARAKSEAGHGSTADISFRRTDVPLPLRAPKSHLGHSFSPSPSSPPQVQSRTQENGKLPEMPPRSQSSFSHYAGGLRKRASASTSALTPSAAAKRASVLVASNANLGNVASDSRTSVGQFSNGSRSTQSTFQQPSRGRAMTANHVNAARNSRAPSESDSEDDAPLATLVGPRRPGSAMSSYSNLHSRSTGNVTTRSAPVIHQKPLIDINELTTPKKSFTAPAEKSNAGFTQGPTLLSQGKPSSYFSSSPLVESPLSSPISTSPWHAGSDDNEPLTRKVPPVKFVSPPGSPAKEMKQFIGSSNSLERVHNDPKPELHAIPPQRRDTSPEPRRDPITDRLSRAVKNNLTPHSGSPVGLNSSSTTPQNASSPRDTSPLSGDTSHSSRKQQQEDNHPRVEARRQKPSIPPSEKLDPSPPDEELAQLLGSAGIRFISRNGETPEDSTESESEEEDEDEEKEKTATKERIAPIPIRQRAPPPAFSVTSRPPVPRQENAYRSTNPPEAAEMKPSPRPRSTTVINSSSSPSVGLLKPSGSDSLSAHASPTHVSSKSASHIDASAQAKIERPAELRPSGARQRSSSMLTGVPLSTQMPRPTYIPENPFAARRKSPASSTGDSSSGRAPLTPRDGSEVGVHEEPKDKKRDDWNGGASALGTNKRQHIKRRSVSFEEDSPDLRPPSRSRFRDGGRSSDGGNSSNEDDREERRRERRRTEARAAIELGNVVNGPAPTVDDDDDMPINQTMNPRMSTMNPMMGMSSPMSIPMGFGGSPNPAGWGGNMGQSMLSPAQYMMPPPPNPNFLAAHQQAMVIAKQAYQMAVAQQAMAAAADEWERSSAMGGFGGGGGSVYGGSSGSQMMSSPFGMMNVMQGGGWPSSASVYGGGTRSMYGGNSLGPGDGMISSSRSEYGGGGRGGPANWSSSRSSYGESFGPSSDQYGRKAAAGPVSRRTRNDPRHSGYFPPLPSIPASQTQSGQSSPDGLGNPRSRTTSQPSSPSRSVGVPRKAPPPSSWKAGV